MSKQRTDEELNNHKKAALSSIDHYLDSLIKNNDPKVKSKADKLSYWFETYIDYLEKEKIFDPKKRKSYKRGEIIKADLGYNIGSEEGGLHYCVVIDKKNPLTSPVITVIPLTSVKPCTDIEKLKAGCIYIGNELFVNLSSSINGVQRQATDSLDKLRRKIDEIKEPKKAVSDEIKEELIETEKVVYKLERMKKEISRMKKGSIALIGQITTISKMRIHNPKNSNDVLSGIKLSNEKLDMIDNEIRKLYTNFVQNEWKKKVLTKNVVYVIIGL